MGFGKLSSKMSYSLTDTEAVVLFDLGYMEEWTNPRRIIKTFQQELDKDLGPVCKVTLKEL